MTDNVMTSVYLAYASLVMAGRLSASEAEAGADFYLKNIDNHNDPSGNTNTVSACVSTLMSCAARATGLIRVNCGTCDGRGFFRGHKLNENEAITVYCDTCDGSGIILVEW